MKKLTLFLLIMAMFTITGCKDNKKDLHLPKAKNDKVYTTIGGENETHQSESFAITIPAK